MEEKFLSQPPVDDFGLRAPDYVYIARLAADTVQSITIPANQKRYKAVMRYSGDVYVASLTITLPVAGAFSASSELQELSPPCREVDAEDVLYFRARAAADVSVSLYAIEQ
jgi:hypothetical protein